MRYIVCYDIADDRRRNRLATALLDFGKRAQESVFLADLDEALAAEMIDRIRAIVRADEDKVHIFPACKSCTSNSIEFGRAERIQDSKYYVI